MSVVEVSDLSYHASGRDILKLSQWKVPQGEHSLVLGLSGSGKTTLLHLLAGLLQPSTGAVRIAGHDIYAYSEHARDEFRGRHIGIIFQTLHLVGALSVLDNLRLAQSVVGRRPDNERLRSVLAQVGLSHRIKAMPSQLSHGERQRVAVARAIVNEPLLVLADEPTSALDDEHCESTAQLLLQHAEACKATLVIATHDKRLRAFVQREIVLPRGEGIP